MSTAQPPPQNYPPQGQPVQPESPLFPPIGKKKPWWKKKRFIIPGILAALILVGSLANGDDPAPTTAVPAAPSSTAAPADPTTTKAAGPTKTTEAPKPEPTKTTKAAPKPEPEEPSLTRAQENAIESAESYLESAAFSKKGLVEQLKYEEYSTKDAQFAVAYLEKEDLVDWNEEAAESAESYLDSGSFSRKGLIEQLEYEGYTQKQAEYGVKQAGL